MIDIQVVIDKLAQFQTADEIAGFLVEHNIKGTPTQSRHCAISEFIKQTTGNVKVYTSTEDITYWNVDHLEWLRFETSSAIANFIGNFDNGLYPELMKIE